MVCADTINLFGIIPVMRTCSCFYVNNGNVKLGRCKSPGQSGIRIAIEQNAAGLLFNHSVFKGLEHASSHVPVRSARDSKIFLRLWNIQFPKKGFGHVVVIVLTRVDERLANTSTLELMRNNGSLDKLRARPNNCQNLATHATAPRCCRASRPPSWRSWCRRRPWHEPAPCHSRRWCGRR